MASIRAKTGSNKGKSYTIGKDALTIGREETQTIQILDQGVSRAHAEIFRIGDVSFVRDLNSTNGTFVNNVRVIEEGLKPGDEVLIGTTVLVFEDEVSVETPRVEEEGVSMEEGRLKETTTIELKVVAGDEKALKGVGKEIQSRHITLVSQVGRIVQSETDLERIFERTLEIVCGALGANHGYVFKVDPETGKLTPRALVVREESESDKKISRTIVQRVLQSRMPLLTSDATVDGRFALSESIVLRRIKSVVCAPILLNDTVEGLLYFHSDRVGNGLKVEDLELATSVALQLSMALQGGGVNDRERQGLLSVVRSLVSAMEIVDPKTKGHAQRVADTSVVVATEMRLQTREIEDIRLAAMVHDVGVIALPPPEPGTMLDQLRERHVYSGERVLSGIKGFEQILPGVRFHHERADGSGYPYRVKNDDTPVMARVIIVTNAFDNACAAGGLGGQSLSPADVVNDFATRAGKDFDGDVIKALVECHRNGSLYRSPSVPVA